MKRVYLPIVVALIIAAALAYTAVHAHNQQIALAKATAAQHLAAKKTPVTTAPATQTSTPTAQSPTPTQPATQPSAPAVAAKPAPTPAPAPAPKPAPITVDFTLSPATVTIAQGAESPELQAISANGQPIWWGVLGGNGIFATEGLVSNSAEAVHTFKLSPSPNLAAPGTYQMNILGYIPEGPSVTKQLTIIVTPMATTPQN